MKLADTFIRSLPKVVLHDHLDGGLRAQTAIELAKEHASLTTSGEAVPVSLAAKHAFACPHGRVLAKVNSRAATATPLARDAVPALLSGSPELIAEEGILRADFAPRAFDIGHWNGNRQPDSFPRRVAPVLL